MDINELAQNILKQEDERLAKAFTMCIGGLLVSNGIQPILNKTCEEWSENDDLNSYIIRKEYQVGFDIDTTEHDKQIRANAFHEILNEMNKSPFLDKKISMVKRYIEEQLKEHNNES